MDSEVKQREVAFFSNLLADKQGISVDAANLFINKFFDLITEGLSQDNYVHVKGLGSFKVIATETVTDDTINKLVFVPEQELQSLINKPFEHFEAVVVSSDLLKDQLRKRQEEKEEGVAIIDGEEQDIELSDADDNSEIQEEENSIDADDMESDNEGAQIEDEEINKVEERTNHIIESEKEELQVGNANQEEQMEDDNKNEILDTEETQSQHNVEDSFIDVYGEESNGNSIEDELHPQEDVDSEVIQEKVVITAETDSKRSSSMGMLVFVIVILSLLVLLLTFRLFSIKRELDIYVEHRTEAKAFEGVTDDTIILYPEESETNKEEVYDDSEGIFEEDLIDNQASLKNIEDIGVVDTYKIPSRASLAYTITGTKTTHQVASGETLRIIAEFYFGSRDMWPYIYYYNESLIRNPNQVQKDIILRIPTIDFKLNH